MHISGMLIPRQFLVLIVFLKCSSTNAQGLLKVIEKLVCQLSTCISLTSCGSFLSEKQKGYFFSCSRWSPYRLLSVLRCFTRIIFIIISPFINTVRTDQAVSEVLMISVQSLRYTDVFFPCLDNGKNMIEREWSQQHFYRLFEARNERDVDRLLKLMGWKVFTIGSDGSMNFSHGYLEPQRLCEFLESLMRCRVRHLTLDYNKCERICRAVGSVRFEQLQSLSLSGNQIRSLEPLERIDCQFLRLLLLENNHLTTIRPLRKISLPCLQTLVLSNNRLSEIFPVISQMNSPHLATIQTSNNRINEYIYVLVKVESNCLSDVDMSACRTVIPPRRSVKAMMLKRQTKLDRYLY